MALRQPFLLGTLFLTSCFADQFICGEEGPFDTPRICDRPQEVCVCSVQRCAKPEPSCQSDHSYTFPNVSLNKTECVPPEEIDTRYPQQGQTEARCPARRTPDIKCGALSEAGEQSLCPDGQVCICGTNRCAKEVRVNAACPTGLKYALDGREGGGSCLSELDAHTRISASADLLCPLQPTGTCGQPGGASCAEDEHCICGLGRCATFTRACASDFRLSLDGRGGSGTCLAENELQEGVVEADMICPAYIPQESLENQE